MKALVAGLLVIGLAALSAFAGMASAVSFDLSYSDPASDVAKLWTSNMTHVLNAAGNATFSPSPPEVNLLRLESANASANINLTIEVKGTIANLDNTSYEIRLYTRSDNASHFIVTYVNRTAFLTSNATGSGRTDLSGSSAIIAIGPNPNVRNGLRISVAKSLLGAITYWNIDATATQVSGDGVYTYQDAIWYVPGNPGSTPVPPASPSSFPGWTWIAAVVVVGAVLVAIAAVIRRKKSEPPKPSSPPP